MIDNSIEIVINVISAVATWKCANVNEQLSLLELTRQYFGQKYEYYEPDQEIRGRSGHRWKFDAIIKCNERDYGVFVRNWNRSIGINQIRQLEKACRDTKLAGGIIVGDIFSSNAEIFGEHQGIQVVDRATLMSKIHGFY